MTARGTSGKPGWRVLAGGGGSRPTVAARGWLLTADQAPKNATCKWCKYTRFQKKCHWGEESVMTATNHVCSMVACGWLSTADHAFA